MPDMFMFIIAVFAVVAVVMAVLSSIWRRKRREALAAASARLGWMFSAGPFDGEARVEGHPYILFESFRDGHDQEFENLMSGEIACGARPGEAGVTIGCEAGDFKWVTGSGKERRTHNRSYLLFDVSHDLGATPSLLIRPEGFTDRIFDAFGGGDIDFESEEFSRRFYVKSSDKRFAFAVIDPRMMEFLLSTPNMRLGINAGWGLILSEGGRWEPADFAWAAGWVREFIEHWPEYLVKQCREGTW